MVHEQLQDASERLREAAVAVDDEETERRLYEQSDQMAAFATAERGPDHGRIARHQNALGELADATDGAAREAIEDAGDALSAYRETVEGV